MTNSNKSLEKIISKGKKDKLLIDKRIKNAINKVGRADYQFLHSNCQINKQTYSNGRIKSMIITYKGHNLVINPNNYNQANSHANSNATTADNIHTDKDKKYKKQARENRIILNEKLKNDNY